MTKPRRDEKDIWRCSDCKHDFERNPEFYLCPMCGSDRIIPVLVIVLDANGEFETPKHPAWRSGSTKDDTNHD